MSIKKTYHQDKLDSDESIFFSRELEVIKAKTYDVKYAALKYLSLLPLSTEAGPGAEKITYRQYDALGMAKIISNYADDLPRVDVKGKEFSSAVKSLGDAYGYNIQEIRAARMAGKPLEQRRAGQARRAIEQLANKLAFFGDAAAGIIGLLSNPNVSTVTLPADGTGASKLWSTKTPDQILRDMNLVANSIVANTKGVEVPDTMLLPIEQYNYIASTARSANSDTTILAFFKANNPYVKNVEWLNELDNAGTGGVLDVMVCYRKDPDAIQVEVPSPFEQLEPEKRGLEYIIDCLMRFGGVSIFYPLSVAKAEGL